MGAVLGVTEIIMYYLRAGIELEHATLGTTAGQAFVRLLNIIKSQPGFIRQYWGHQVENPTVFVWSIDWKSISEATTFKQSEANKALTAELGQFFDLEKDAPLRMCACFNSDPGAAFQSGTTEIALYTLPTKDYTEETRHAIDKWLDAPSMEGIKQFGAGGATGWVFETQNDAEPEGHTIALLGVFGYPTVDHHRRWRENPEHAQVMKELEAASPKDIDMRSANVPGRGLFVPGESIFHVKFRASDMKSGQRGDSGTSLHEIKI